jgi:dephospho-CoA kinase
VGGVDGEGDVLIDGEPWEEGVILENESAFRIGVADRFAGLHIKVGGVLRVGLTGGIGAGKSTVAKRLEELGALVIDADQIAREVVAPGTPGLEAVIKEFGSGVVAPDGSLDRGELGALVFSDDERRAALNSIIHPLVYQRRSELVAEAAADAVVVEDIPLLVENQLAPSYPLVVVVHATEEARIHRLVSRGLGADDARARIRAQAGDDERRAAADVWLDNTGPVERLMADVEQLWSGRLVPFESNCRFRRPASRPRQPVIVEAEPRWADEAARLQARIGNVLGERVLQLDHVGSTSVPGLPAKDVIDLQLVVADLDSAIAVADELLEAGFVRMPDRWFDVWRDGSEIDKAMACNADPGRAVNLHIRPASSPVARDVLLLRDWLRANPGGVAEYAALKRRLAAAEYERMDDYARQKTPWINAALQRAEPWAEHAGWNAGR